MIVMSTKRHFVQSEPFVRYLKANYTLYDDVTYKHQQSLAISKKGKSIDRLKRIKYH